MQFITKEAGVIPMSLLPYFDPRHMLPRSMKNEVGQLPPTGEMYKEYIRIALPSVCEMVLISLINMMDTVMVSSIGTDAVAAVGLVGQPRMIMLSLFFALNTGITAVIARRKGEEIRQKATRPLRASIMMILLLSAILLAVLLPLGRSLMLFAGAEAGRTLESSTEYFTILGWALPFQALSMGLCAAQRGVGNTKLTMQVNIASNVVNIVFNYLLINGIGPFPKLGVRGAAIATAIGLVVGFFLSVRAMFHSHGAFLSLSRHDSWKPDLPSVKALTQVSSSAMVEQLAMRIGFFAYARIVADLGTDAFAAHQICGQFLNLSFSFADGLGIAGTSLVGQMLGRKRRDLAHVYGTLAQRFSLAIGLGLAAACILLRDPLVSMFISGDETGAVRAMAVSTMVVLGLIQPVQMVSVVTAGALRGAGDVKYTARTMLITVTCIRPVLALLGVYICQNVLHRSDIALVAAWAATLVDMIVRVTLMLRRYHSEEWHSIRV